MADEPPTALGTRLPSQMGVDVFVAIPDAASFASSARDWFAHLPGLLAPEEWEEVLREDKPPFLGRPQVEWPLYEDWREPFMTWGQIVVAPLKWRGMRVWQRRATKRNLVWLAEILADRPVSAKLHICRVDANGIELPGGVAVTAQAALGPADNQIPVGRLTAGDSLAWRAGSRPGHASEVEELSARQAAVARGWAGRDGVMALFAGEDLTYHGSALTASLEPALHWDEAVLLQELPGYSWITLCRPGVTERLGGSAALAASGAFWRVDELPGEAVLLQATEHASDYGISQAKKVFEVLAPALPEGMPKKPANWSQDVPWLVVPEDAAAWRRGSGAHGSTLDS
jgi:hypothetical protein